MAKLRIDKVVKDNVVFHDHYVEDIVDLVAPFQFKGEINVNSDFPTSSEVENGWTYTIGTDVTDNDPTKTNTGQTFLKGDEIAWNGTDWTVIGNELIWTKDGTTIKPAVTGNDLDMLTGDATIGGHMAIGEDALVEARHLLDMDGIITAGGQGIFLVPSVNASGNGISGMRIRPEIESNRAISGTGSNAMIGTYYQDIGLGTFSSNQEYIALYFEDIDNSSSNYVWYSNAGEMSIGDDVTIRKSFQDVKFSEDGFFTPTLNFADGYVGSFASGTIGIGNYDLINLGYISAGAMDAIALGPDNQILIHGDDFYSDDVIEFYGGLITINDDGDLNINSDSSKIYLGTSKDVSIGFDGTYMMINSENVTANDRLDFTDFDQYNFYCPAGAGNFGYVARFHGENPGTHTAIRIDNDAAADVENLAFIDFACMTSTQSRTTSYIYGNFVNTTDATRTGNLDFRTLNNGTTHPNLLIGAATAGGQNYVKVVSGTDLWVEDDAIIGEWTFVGDIITNTSSLVGRINLASDGLNSVYADNNDYNNAEGYSGVKINFNQGLGVNTITEFNSGGVFVQDGYDLYMMGGSILLQDDEGVYFGTASDASIIFDNASEEVAYTGTPFNFFDGEVMTDTSAIIMDSTYNSTNRHQTLFCASDHNPETTNTVAVSAIYTNVRYHPDNPSTKAGTNHIAVNLCNLSSKWDTGSSTVNNWDGFIVEGNWNTSGNAIITEMAAFRVTEFDNTYGGTITTLSGIRVEDVTAGTNNYAFKSGLGEVYHGDVVTVETSSTGQSSFSQGLIVNNAGGNTSADNFIAETGSVANAFLVDAVNDTVNTNTGRIMNTSRYTSNQTLTAQDHVVFANGTFTISLPSGVEGTEYRIVNTGNGTINIAPNGSENLIGENSNFTLNSGDALIINYNSTDGWY